MQLTRYKENLSVSDGYIYSYDTRVAKIVHRKRLICQLGWWSVTTQKHINYVANEYNYELDRYYYKGNKTDDKTEDKTSNIFNMLKNVCAVGNILNDTKEDKVKFNKRMLSASGVTFPDDFDTLPLEEQEKRINLALDTLEDNKNYNKQNTERE